MDNSRERKTVASGHDIEEALRNAGVVMEVIDDEPTKKWVSPHKVAEILFKETAAA